MHLSVCRVIQCTSASPSTNALVQAQHGTTFVAASGMKTMLPALSIPAILFIILAAFSLLVGWTLFTLLTFWFIAIPVATLAIANKLAGKARTSATLIGLIAFYGIIASMIYDHYQSDYFLMMMISCILNVILVYTISVQKFKKR